MDLRLQRKSRFSLATHWIDQILSPAALPLAKHFICRENRFSAPDCSQFSSFRQRFHPPFCVFEMRTPYSIDSAMRVLSFSLLLRDPPRKSADYAFVLHSASFSKYCTLTVPESLFFAHLVALASDHPTPSAVLGPTQKSHAAHFHCENSAA